MKLNECETHDIELKNFFGCIFSISDVKIVNGERLYKLFGDQPYIIKTKWFTEKELKSVK